MHVTLPLPPSSNTAYPTDWVRRRRHKSEKLETWLKENMGTLYGVTDRFVRAGIRIKLFFPNKRRRDVLNYQKVLIDAIVAANIIPDDNFMVLSECHISGVIDRDNPRVEVYMYGYKE